jgi:hypothetical protein
MNEGPIISPQQKFGYILAICLLPILLIFFLFGQPERGFIICCLSGVFGIIIYVNRGVAKRMYFILTLSILFFAQLLALLVVNVPKHHFPGLAIMPFAFVDLFLITGVLKLVETVIGVNRENKVGRSGPGRTSS